MKIGSFGYLIREGAKNIYVNRLMSFASIGTLVACMLLIGSSILLSMNVNQIVGYVEQQNELTAFLEDDVTDEEAVEIEEQLREIENILDPVYLNKEAVLKEQMSSMGDAADLFEGLEGEENPFPPTFRMHVRDLSLLTSTIMKVSDIDGVVKVIGPDSVAEIVTSLKKAISQCGMIIVGVLLAVSLVIIANTIKITVFNRRKEINIMKYVGATDIFIRLPFFVEGFLLGLISAMIAFGLLWVGYDYILRMISQNPSDWIQQTYASMIQFKDVAVELLCWFAGGGVGVGVFGSMVFVSKYLKV